MEPKEKEKINEQDYIKSLEDQLERARSDLSRMEAELRLTQERCRTILKGVDDTVTIYDKDLNMRMINRDIDLKNKKCYEFFFNEKEMCEDCSVLKTIKEKKGFITEKKIGPKHYRIKTYPLLNHQTEIAEVVEFSKAINREEEMELQLYHANKLSSIGLMVSGILHEISNPNQYICGNIPLIREAFKDIFPILDEYNSKTPDLKIAHLPYNIFKEQSELMIEDMMQGCSLIQNILGNLKGFVRKDERFHIEDIDLNVVVREGLRLVRNPLKRKAVIHTDLEEDLPGVKAIKGRLIQIFVNLMLNAWQAIEQVKGNIWIITRYEKDSDTVTLKIRDDGCGMNEITRQQIFYPFFTSKKDGTGTGLGLSIVSTIIKEHKGAIDVESEIGKGTTFTITLSVK